MYTHITMFPHFNFLQMFKAHLDKIKFFLSFCMTSFFPKGDLIFTHMLMPCTSYLYLCFLHTWLFTRSEVCVKVNHLMIMYHKFFFSLTFLTYLIFMDAGSCWIFFFDLCDVAWMENCINVARKTAHFIAVF